MGAGQRGHRIVMFAVQRDRVARMGGGAGNRGGGVPAGGCRRDGGRLRAAEQEGGVGGEHDMGQRLAPARGEAGKIGRVGQRVEPRGIGSGIDRGDQPPQPRGAGHQPVAFQFRHQRGDIVQPQRAAFQLA